MVVKKYQRFSALSLVALSCLVVLEALSSSEVFAIEYFSEDEKPFGREYADWVGEWWNWWIGEVHKDNVTNIQLEQKNCLAKTDGPVVFLMDPTFAGAEKREKVCEISSDQGILFNFLTAECDSGLYEGSVSYEELRNCALEDDQGTLQKEAFVDGVRVPDESVKEVFTDLFNITIGENNVYDADPGQFEAAAHGWYVFVKPLPEGEHTLQYKSALFGVPYAFTSDNLYTFNVTADNR